MSSPELYTIDLSSTSQRGTCYLEGRGSFKATCGLDNYIFWGDLELGSSQWAVPAPVPDVQLKQRFNSLATRWKKETMNLSFVQQMVLHPAYQEIIGLGPGVIPLILNELEKEPDFWFWALRSLTAEDPTTKEMRGDLEAMTDAWLTWGRENAYL